MADFLYEGASPAGTPYELVKKDKSEQKLINWVELGRKLSNLIEVNEMDKDGRKLTKLGRVNENGEDLTAPKLFPKA